MSSQKKEKKELTPEEKAAKERLKIERNTKNQRLEFRREREFELWIGGGSFRVIAEKISEGGETISKSTVEKDINLMLDRMIKENPEGEQLFQRIRRKAVIQLDSLILPFMVQARKGKVKEGELVVKILDKMVDICGAKRPLKVESSGTVDNVQYTLAEWKAEQQKRREQAANTKQLFADES